MHYVVVRDIGYRFYKAVLYFQNTLGSSKHENVISLTPKKKSTVFPAPIFTKLALNSIMFRTLTQNFPQMDKF
jgi:hypothetical protein